MAENYEGDAIGYPSEVELETEETPSPNFVVTLNSLAGTPRLVDGDGNDFPTDDAAGTITIDTGAGGGAVRVDGNDVLISPTAQELVDANPELAGGGGNSVLYTAQSPTFPQQAQGRSNLGITQVVYVSSSTPASGFAAGNDANDGLTAAEPILSLDVAAARMDGKGEIRLLPGDYFNIGLTDYKDIKLRGYLSYYGPTRFFYGEKKNGTAFTLESGFIYYTTITTDIPADIDPGPYPAVGVKEFYWVFEWDTPEDDTEITQAIRHPLQKNQTHRLMHARLSQVTSLGAMTEGTFFFNGALNGGTLYIWRHNNAVPGTDDFWIPFTSVAANKTLVYSAPSFDCKIEVEDVQVFFAWVGIEINAVHSATLKNVTVYGCNHAGAHFRFCDFSQEWNCEYAACGGDGVDYVGFENSDNLFNHSKHFAFDTWAHDCGDQGTSWHQQTTLHMYGGLVESCRHVGIGGPIGPLICYNVESRNNAYAGFEVYGSSSTGETDPAGLLFNCRSDSDEVAVHTENGARVIVIGGSVVNSTTAAFYAGSGTIIDEQDVSIDLTTLSTGAGTVNSTGGRVRALGGNGSLPGLSFVDFPTTGFWHGGGRMFLSVNTGYNGSWGTGGQSVNSTLPFGFEASTAGTAMDVAFSRLSAGLVALGTGAAGSFAGSMKLRTVQVTGSSSGVITIGGAATAGTWTLTLPTDDGTSGQFLQTDGNGVTSWQTVASDLTVGSTAIASGADTRVLFQDGSVLGGDAGLTYNKTTDTLTALGGFISGSVGGANGSINLYGSTSGFAAISSNPTGTLLLPAGTQMNTVDLLSQTNTVSGITNKTFVAPVLGEATGTSLALSGNHVLGTGGEIHLHNQADQTTNYERLSLNWSSTANIATIETMKGGSGSNRNLRLLSLGGTLYLDAGSANGGVVVQSNGVLSESSAKFSLTRNAGLMLSNDRVMGFANATTVGTFATGFSHISNTVIGVGNGTDGSRAAWLHWAGQSYIDADATVADATLVTTGLSVTLTSARKYAFKAVLYMANSTGADGLKIDLDGGTATATNIRAAVKIHDSIFRLSTWVTALATDVELDDLTGDTEVVIEGSITVNAGGTFIIRFAEKDDGGGTLTLYRGSHLLAWDMP